VFLKKKGNLGGARGENAGPVLAEGRRKAGRHEQASRKRGGSKMKQGGFTLDTSAKGRRCGDVRRRKEEKSGGITLKLKNGREGS